MERQLKYAFRITHIENIPHILNYGIVTSDSPNRNGNFVPIGDSKIIDIRKERVNKKFNLSNYIPFYFGPRSPMLYVIQHGYNGVPKTDPDKIIYCVIRIDDLIRDNINCIFTDGHALSALTSFFDKNQLGNINNIINYDDVYSSRWDKETDIDLKRRKEAELLIENDLPLKYIRGYVVYNNEAKNLLMRFGIREEMIVVDSRYYF